MPKYAEIFEITWSQPKKMQEMVDQVQGACCRVRNESTIDAQYPATCHVGNSVRQHAFCPDILLAPILLALDNFVHLLLLAVVVALVVVAVVLVVAVAAFPDDKRVVASSLLPPQPCITQVARWSSHVQEPVQPPRLQKQS